MEAMFAMLIDIEITSKLLLRNAAAIFDLHHGNIQAYKVMAIKDL